MITPIYAAILTFILLFLTINVIKTRQKNHVALGDGGNADLIAAIRMHGNFIETAPWGLMLMFLIEYQDGNFLALHILGMMLVVGRCLHLYALKKSSISIRVAGMMCTFAVFGLGALYNLYLAFTVGV